MTERFEVKKRKLAQLRRKNDFFTNEENDTHLHKIRKLSGEIATTEHGYIHLEAAAWKELDIEEKKLIQKYNARVKHNENYKDVKFPEGVTIVHKARRLRRVISLNRLITQLSMNLQLRKLKRKQETRELNLI